MNCFNIRELQGILKRKFFTDLVNSSDSHKSMESTLLNMRHKNNMSNILLYDQSLFYNFDLTNTFYINFNLLNYFTNYTRYNASTNLQENKTVLKEDMYTSSTLNYSGFNNASSNIFSENSSS
jgi:hypothetical protein